MFMKVAAKRRVLNRQFHAGLIVGGCVSHETAYKNLSISPRRRAAEGSQGRARSAPPLEKSLSKTAPCMGARIQELVRHLDRSDLLLCVPQWARAAGEVVSRGGALDAYPWLPYSAPSTPPTFTHEPRVAPRLVPGFNSCLGLICILVTAMAVFGQDPAQNSGKGDTSPKKANTRPGGAPVSQAEPFEGAPVEKMAGQCVTLETEAGAIEIEMLPEAAPESVRNFLNLAATGALDTTTFSRVVKDFVVQGGNLSTSEKWSFELSRRASRKLPDEPGLVKHVRGIVSMARPEEPNSATTHFFILVGDGHHLDGKFSAFGRVTKGLEVADAINHAPAEGEKPVKAVRINRAVVAPCVKQ
jgi:peptidyl-prolyl cis-trans isomerase B (cyclophilin B)